MVLARFWHSCLLGSCAFLMRTLNRRFLLRTLWVRVNVFSDPELLEWLMGNIFIDANYYPPNWFPTFPFLKHLVPFTKRITCG